jgi:hypothetical protein
MNALTRLQRWYSSQCDGDWEHTWGVKIGTLDNPGWSIDIDLCETTLEGKPFQERSYGISEDADASGDEWIICKMEGTVFKGAGGPHKLEEMIEVFLEWAEKNS